MSQSQQILFVTGVSGSGKGTAVRALEDAGYFCIDNLPVPVVPRLLELFGQASGMRRLALGVDARERSFLAQAPSIVADARALVKLLFLDASDEAVLRRFSETRRRHPLAPDGSVLEGLRVERELLSDLRAAADELIDTSHTTVHELKALVLERSGSEEAQRLGLSIMSFGYRYGLPPQADLVLDVRFLPNPYFVPELRDHPGTAEPVSRWVLERPPAGEFLGRIRSLLVHLLPQYRAEGKAYLTVALGCTGGRHRSVAMAEARGAALAEEGHRCRVGHRDVDRGH